jgi:anti-sigma factor RsiW
MNCDQALALINPYVDGELDLMTSLDLERHLAECQTCAAEEAALRGLRSTIRDTMPYRGAPATLRKSVGVAIRDARRADRGPSLMLRRSAWAGAVAAILLAAIVLKGPFHAPPGDLTARELVDNHLRSLTPNHLTDVLSSNQHTVKPWFDGRINFTPTVEDFAADGFPLIGGRIDYLDNHPVAAIVYRCRQHVINLFVWPAPQSTDTPAQRETLAGYNVIHWTKSGMAYWAVSSLGSDQLAQFARLVSHENPKPSMPLG